MNFGTIAFLTSSHLPYDDRIYYHMAKTLAGECEKVFIITTTENISDKVANIEIIGIDGTALSRKTKIDYFLGSLLKTQPQIIICSEPLTVFAAKKYKTETKSITSIIYDITEWYPSKKNLAYTRWFLKPIKFVTLSIINLTAAYKADCFVFGEYHKGLPYRLLFPFKRWEQIGYYPDLDYIKYSSSQLKSNSICLGYTGKISIKKGILSFLKVAEELKKEMPALNIRLKIIGWFGDKQEEEIFKGYCRNLMDIDLEILERQDFQVFSEKIKDIDILFDLRRIDIENTFCLPIKLFFYAACGKPVIYSDLKSIQQFKEVKTFGHLVVPTDYAGMVNIVTTYINNPNLYNSYSLNARNLALSQYNWNNLKPLLFKFIDRIKPE